MAKTITALEITEEGVRAAEITTGKNPTLINYGSVPLPQGAAKDSEVIDVDAVVLALRQLWNRAGFKSRKVVLGIGSRRILVREYTTQVMRPDLLRQALPFQVHDLLPVPPDQAVLDFYPISQAGDQLTGLLVAAVSETVEQLIATVAKAKLTVDVVDLAPFGLARAASRVASAGETVAAFHLGDHTSYVVVVQDGVPRFVRIIPVDISTEAVRRRERGDADESDGNARVAEELFETVPPSEEAPIRRMRGGSRGLARPTGMSDSAITDLVARLRSTLTFYTDRFANEPVTRVLITGAGAATAGVADGLAANLPLPVQFVDVNAVATARRGTPEGEDSLNLLTTLGVAFGQVRS